MARRLDQMERIPPHVYKYVRVNQVNGSGRINACLVAVCPTLISLISRRTQPPRSLPRE